jgi:hypothetical protein
MDGWMEYIRIDGYEWSIAVWIEIVGVEIDRWMRLNVE